MSNENKKDVSAAPRFNILKLEERIAPAIVDVKLNGGGNTPNGQANGVPTVSLNPAGKAPPGQN
jgi:hypothetical protein